MICPTDEKRDAEYEPRTAARRTASDESSIGLNGLSLKAQGTPRTVEPWGEAPLNMKTVLFRPGNKWF